jgi:tRNA modification GTPase
MPGNDSNAGATFAAELTPVGRAAVAVVLVGGPQATRIVGECFAPNRRQKLSDIPFEQIVLGRWTTSGGEELIVYRRSAERIEIQCHGGLAAIRAVLASLVARGCRHVSWQEWLRIDRGDSIEAAAQIALADAPTARTAAILLDQFHGALATAIRQVAAAAIDGNWSHAAKAIESILSHRNVGAHLITPWRVVLAGRTNVGKSSLINALAGFERAIVSRHPGTTRDVVTSATAIDGWPVQLADTAGLRRADDELESAGVRLAVETLQNAELVLAVEDATETDTPSEGEQDDLRQIIVQLQRTRPVIRVRNKIDLISNTDRTQKHRHDDQRGDKISTSAVTGEGIADLISALGRALVPIAPAPGSAVPFTSEQIMALDAARGAIERREKEGVAAAVQPLLSSSAAAFWSPQR